MCNSGQQISTTLWKDCYQSPQKVNHDALLAATVGTPMAITNIKVESYRGVLKLASTDATHVIINPILKPGILDFGRIHSGPSNAVVLPYTVMSITELSSKQHSELLGKRILIEAAIQSCQFSDCWYITICPKCNERITRQGSIWFCITDGRIEQPIF
ncbi:hypothetical protein L1887_15524 [Cichorium endivia]|nr:hypothetical protein L1887_15524 [Cichorium endivia]